MGLSAKSLFFAVLAVFALCATALAVPVTVGNPDFDVFDPGAGNWTVGTMTNLPCPMGTVGCWATTNQAGAFHPTTHVTPLSTPNVAWLNDTSAIHQILSTNAAANTTYTFSVGVGARADGVPISTWRLELYSGTTLLACTDSATTAPGQTGCTVSGVDTPTTGNWNTASLSVTTAADLTGGPLGLRIATFERSPGVAEQLDFDNVVLDASPVNGGAIPEPMTLALTGAGLVGLALVRRRIAR